MSTTLTPEREAAARAIAQAAADDEIIVSDCEGSLEVWRVAALPNFQRDEDGSPSWIVPSSYRPSDLVIEIDLDTWDRGEDSSDDQRRDDIEQLVAARQEIVPALLGEIDRLRAAALSETDETEEPGPAAVLRLDLYGGPEVTVRLDGWGLTAHPEHDVTAQAVTVLSGWVSAVDGADLPDDGPVRIVHAHLPGAPAAELSEVPAYLNITKLDGAHRARLTWTPKGSGDLLPWTRHLSEQQLTDLLDGLADATVPHAPVADRLVRVIEVLAASRTAALGGAS
ncbi:hypothetical protein ACGFX7_06395 [Streptomyces harbinensis]|uniref:hypothetical protein n=1 Tax=Streptomyces harbinensis TaxID=1176198 RepID=UPI00370FA8D3